jgi:hypothetical protein
MLSIIITLACNDHYMAYPVDKIQDTEEETIEDPVDTIGIHEDTVDTGDYEDTGYEEPIDETDEPVDTGYEEPVEVEEEDTDTGSTTTTVPTDNYNYSDDFTASKVYQWGGNTHYATDYGYTMIDSEGENVAMVCGLLPTGLVDCFCEEHNSSYPQCNNASFDVMNHIPFQSFVDVSVAIGQICTIDSNGSALCWDESGTTFNLPQMNPYVDIVALRDHQVCALDSQGSLYCFDTSTGGLLYSDSNTYKAIEGKYHLTCGVLESADGIECVNLPTSNSALTTTSYAVNYEIIGMDASGQAGRQAFCWVYLDANGMQNVECYQWSNNANNPPPQCLYSAPHEYYYDFFTNNTDLSNIEVYGGWGAFYDSAQNLEVRWGGASTYNQVINNGYWTGSGCNYYWGN